MDSRITDEAWRDAFAKFARYPTPARGGDGVRRGYVPEDVEHVVALDAVGDGLLGLFFMRDGSYLTLRASIDQDWGDLGDDGAANVTDNLEDAVFYGLEAGERDALADQIPGIV